MGSGGLDRYLSTRWYVASHSSHQPLTTKTQSQSQAKGDCDGLGGSETGFS